MELPKKLWRSLYAHIDPNPKPSPKQLLHDVAHKLRNLEPDEVYDQETFGSYGTDKCGCIAFWTNQLLGNDTTQMDSFQIKEAAAKALDLTDEQAKSLFRAYPYQVFAFFSKPWQEPYATRFYKAKHGESDETPAQVAADYLDAIANGEVIL